jgi:hypothetical protein
VDVALQSADEALVGGSVDEDLEVEPPPQLAIDQDQDALDDDDRGRLDGHVAAERSWRVKS